MRKWLVILFIAHPALAAPIKSNEESELKRRVQQLEQQIEALQKSHESFVESITKSIKDGALAEESALELEKHIHSKLQPSGYADIEYRNSSLDGSHPGFRIHHFSLILTKEISEHWRSFAEVEYEDAPRVEFEPGSPICQGTCSGRIFLEAMNIDYAPSNYFGVRLGRFFTPAGIWSIAHYPPFVATQETPLHIHRIFPQLMDGAMVHGTVPLAESFLNYDVYFGNGEGSTANSDNNDKKALGLRAAIQTPWLTQFELGASASVDTLDEPNNATTTKIATGVHAQIRSGSVAFQSEAATAKHEPQGSTEYTTTGYYAQLGIDVLTATIGYRYDFFREYDEQTTTQLDTNRHSLFVNYAAHKNVILKLEHHETSRGSAAKERLIVASVAVYLGE